MELAIIKKLKHHPRFSCDIINDCTKLTREEWLSERKKGLGCSDLGSIAGLNPWRSAIDVFLDKTNKAKPFDGNIATEVGSFMEPFLRKKFAEWIKESEGLDVKVIKEKYMIQNPEYPFLLGDLDGSFYHKDYGWTVLELKTASIYKDQEWKEEEIPDSYYAQILGYMAITGAKVGYICCLIGNSKFVAKKVERNEETIQSLLKVAETFWNENVLKNIPPSYVDGNDSTTEALNILYPDAEKDKSIDISDMEDIYSEYKQLSDQKREIDTKLEEIKQKFMFKMGNAEIGLVGDHKITWKLQERKEHLVKASKARVMRIN